VFCNSLFQGGEFIIIDFKIAGFKGTDQFVNSQFSYESHVELRAPSDEN